jgi:hypothetical protein
MERPKSKTAVKSESTTLKVVQVNTNQALIEQEIEKQIRKIRSLIKKLRPAERQKYFDGFLSHILNETTQTNTAPQKLVFDIRPPQLSVDEMKLLEELSVKMEELYRTMDHDPS